MPIVEINSLACCGVAEVNEVSNYNKPHDFVFDTLTDELYSDSHVRDGFELELPSCAHIIFTQASITKIAKGYGYNLKQYIEENNLGNVIVSPPARNPNTGNHIHVFVWTLNDAGIEKWAKKHGIQV